MRTVRLILWIVFSIFVIAFAVLNRQIVDVWLLPTTSTSLPLFIIFFAGIFVGLIAAALVTGWLRLKSYTARRHAERSERETAIERDTARNQLAEERRRHMSTDLDENGREKPRSIIAGNTSETS